MELAVDLLVIKREEVEKLKSHLVHRVITTEPMFPSELVLEHGLEHDNLWGGFEVSYFEPHLKFGELVSGVMIRKTKEELLQLCKDIREEEEMVSFVEGHVNMYLSDLENVLSQYGDEGYLFFLRIDEH